MQLVKKNERVDREAMALQRRRILFPFTCEALPHLWPPSETTPFVGNMIEKSNVAVVIVCPPTLTGYESLSRHTAELISTLVQNGVRPTLIDLSAEKQRKETLAAIKSSWPENSVIYRQVAPPKVPAVRGPLGQAAKKAYWLYEWLKNQCFDVVHAPDFYGTLYFCLRAKEQGIGFLSTRFVVHSVDSILPKILGEYISIDDIQLLPRIYLERSSIELADTVPLPCEASLRRLLDVGISVNSGCIEHYPWPVDRMTAKAAFKTLSPEATFPPARRVLCLPGTSRRGIALFCKTLMRGFSEKHVSLSVKFGVPSASEKDFAEYINALTADLPYSIIVQPVNSRNALSELLLKEPDTLCIFPVVDDSNYYQLKELAAAGIPLLVADRYIAEEFFEDAALDTCSCAPLPDVISKQIFYRLDNPDTVPDLKEETPIPSSWVTPAIPLSIHNQDNETPLVTICLMHFERPHLVEQALSSIEKQTYGSYEVVLLDDGSLKKDTLKKLEEIKKRFSQRGWQVIRQQNLYLGAARNTAAMAANGKYLFFLDDDNILRPNALEVLVKVAEHLEADVIAALSDTFEGNDHPDSSAYASRRIIQVGDDLSYGFFRNAFGDSNALIRKSTFLALGGNTEDYAVGMDDQEFFARAVLNGCKITVIPEALYWARQMPTRLRNLHFNPKAGHVRVCRAYLPYVPTKLQPMLLLASGIMESIFEGKDITLGAYLTCKIRHIAHSRLGTKLRFGFIGPILRRVRQLYR
ncbi:MAG: glycosyltransferase [Desulfobacterales bacterium]|nr:glycosyltransferase [Desulfobacterales bacterium]